MAALTQLKSVNVDNLYNPIIIDIGSAANNNKSVDMTSTVAMANIANSSNSNWSCLASNDANAMLVAVSRTSGTLAQSSADYGVTWVARTLPSTQTWFACAFGNGKFVAVSGGSSTAGATSSDGIVWGAVTLSTAGDYRCMTFGGGKFVALSFGSTAVIYSTDGVSWTTTALPSAANWISVAYDSTLAKFVAVSSGSTSAAYSSDGITWTAATMPFSSNWNCVAANNLGRLVAVTFSSTATHAYTDSGTAWSTFTLTAAVSGAQVVYVPYNDGFWYMRHGNTNLAGFSLDGINWKMNLTVTTSMQSNALLAPKLSWRTNDTLTINNNATVTVNTDQKKYFNATTIINGALNISNTSTTTAIRFTTLGALTPSGELSSVTISGDWIVCGTGDASANQTMTVPYSDYCNCIWVETASGSNVYEKWLNVSGVYHGSIVSQREGITAVGTGIMGNFFTQTPSPTADIAFTLANCSTSSGSRFIQVSTTANMFPGSSISEIGRAHV